MGSLKVGPGIRKTALLRELRGAYEPPFERLAFVTAGWASFIYRVDTWDGEAYLLKLYDESLPTPMLATSREFYLPSRISYASEGCCPRLRAQYRLRMAASR